MPALAHPHDLAGRLPERARPAPLRALPRPRPRRVRAGAVALFALGLTLGFLLAAPASAPGGLDVVTGQLRLAGVCALVAVAACLRARATARRGARHP